MVHGPVLTRERAPREPRAPSDNARDPCHTSFLCLLLFHPESSARPCVSWRISPAYILLLSRYFSRSSFFVTSALRSSFPFLFSRFMRTTFFAFATFLLAFCVRYRPDMFPRDILSGHIYAFLFLVLTYPRVFPSHERTLI